MFYSVRVSVRSPDWDPHSLKTYEDTLTLPELASLLERVIDSEAITINICLWNEHKLQLKRGEKVQLGFDFSSNEGG